MAQGNKGTGTRRDGSPLSPTVHLFVPRARGHGLCPSSALLQLCRVIILATGPDSFRVCASEAVIGTVQLESLQAPRARV